MPPFVAQSFYTKNFLNQRSLNITFSTLHPYIGRFVSEPCYIVLGLLYLHGPDHKHFYIFPIQTKKTYMQLFIN